MVRILSLLLVAAACLAQEARPPADVDKALRERVDEFFRDHVTAHFRQAEALVAEDSKDFFYNTNKPHYMSYGGIQTIRYSDNFTHAYVTVTVESASAADAGIFGTLPSLPIPSMWKIEDGKWCWYVDPEILKRTPFGPIPPQTMAAAMAAMKSPADAAPAPTPIPPDMASALKTSIPDIPSVMNRDPNTPTGQIQVDRKSIEIKPGAGAAIAVRNGGHDTLSLILMGQLKGVEAELDQKQLAPGNSAQLALRAEKNAQSGTINVVVVQTGEIIPIAVTVK